jgi:DNA-binding transcriptional MerR regulator
VPRRVSGSRVPVPVSPSGIPDKNFFKIGEVARICAVKPHVLRYWETEFHSLKPQKSRSQQRVYRRKDVEHLLRIRHLLYEERFTIEGARTRLRELGHDEGPAPEAPVPPMDREGLRRLKQGLVELLSLVED